MKAYMEDGQKIFAIGYIL